MLNSEIDNYSEESVQSGPIFKIES